MCDGDESMVLAKAGLAHRPCMRAMGGRQDYRLEIASDGTQRWLETFNVLQVGTRVEPIRDSSSPKADPMAANNRSQLGDALAATY